MIVIPCYGHTEESLDSIDNADKLRQLGIEVQPDEEYIVKPVYFLSINYVHMALNENETIIGSDGMGFQSPLHINEVLRIINEDSIHSSKGGSWWGRISQAFEAFFLIAFRGHSLRRS